MNAKDYLNQIGIIDSRIKIYDSEIKKIRAELKLIGDVGVSSSWPDGQPHGTLITDPTSRQGIRLAESTNEKREELKKELLEYEYKQIMARSALWAKRMEVLETMSRICSPEDMMSHTYFRLLELRYMEFKTWEQIAVELGYTYRHTTRLHGIALQRLEKILKST